MTSLSQSIVAAPRAFDARRGDEASAAVGAGGALGDLIRGAAGSSPYLADLAKREAEWLADAASVAPDDALCALYRDVDPSAGLAATAAALRRLKRRAALLIALCDLGGAWPLEAVTAALSDLADHAAEAAFAAALAAETSGPLAGLDTSAAGLVILAMGKGGARELNYSSDIDLILLHDDERLGDAALDAKPQWTRIARRAVKLLTEATADGYVFRVDLRLRPNPSVTPICLSMDAAERYYESEGRTWERAAFIKARAAGGDLTEGGAFLDRLRPFVWRRHLDFAALEDINEIRAKIRDAKGLRGRGDLPGYNLKLGPGGIREIEFFAQTQQLAFGGRDAALRERTTIGALGALAGAGKIDPEMRDALSADYRAHRTLEHRLQMIADAQTHSIPTSEDARAQLAALGGWDGADAMETEVSGRLADVRARVRSFFGKSAPRAGGKTVESALRGLPFARPELVREMADRWAEGGVAATRNDRARSKFRALAPVILEKLSAAGDPDEAAIQFDRFLSGLPAGVQIFSLFEANPHLLDLLADICAAAPRLAEYLGRNAGVLDAVLDADFFAPPPGLAALRADLAATLDDDADFEGVLNGVRVWAKERRFRLGVQVLRGVADEKEAGRGFSDVAEACLGALLPAVEDEISRRHGPPPGRGAAVIAMGKLGSGEMTASSDLDLIVVYDAEGADASDGPKPLTVSAYFARLTKALVSALTTLTPEGALYEVDMRLRPSGGQGPVAVSLAGFRSYHDAEAWTWERMALTRARPVAGDATLCADVADAMRAALTKPRDRDATLADVAEMRGRLIEANRAAREELWALKHGAGGLMDIEFAAQNGMLRASFAGPSSPPDALSALAAAGEVAAADAAALIEAYRLQGALQQVERVAYAGAFRAESAGEGLKSALARAGGAEDFAALEDRLAAMRGAAAAIVDRLLTATP